MKFYVQSGNVKRVLTANTELDACVKAVMLDNNKNSCGKTFVVSQKGFVLDRVPFSITIPYEKVIHITDVINHIKGR